MLKSNQKIFSKNKNKGTLFLDIKHDIKSF